jgi:ABC-type dipeptide/oligopeptide/nickel transport system permease subunit
MKYSEKILYSLWKSVSSFVASTLPMILLSIVLGLLGMFFGGPIGSIILSISSFFLLKIPFVLLLFAINTQVLIKKTSNPRNPFSKWELFSQAYLLNIDSIIKTFIFEDPLKRMNKLSY